MDPGLRACGVALFRDGVLVRAGAVRGPREGRGPEVWAALAAYVEVWADGLLPFDSDVVGTLVVETMRHNPHGRSVPVEDLLELAGVAGAVVGRLPGWTAHAAQAHRWKGQVPRDVMGRRVEAHLREEGLWARVEVPSVKDHLNDAMHAVGMGRWWLDGG